MFRLKRAAIFSVVLFILGVIAGHSGKPAPPPLIIQRSANSPLLSPAEPGGAAVANTTKQLIEDDVYICGARTKKGTPCSRRVHGAVRCWQHKGLPSMLPLEKLKVKS